MTEGNPVTGQPYGGRNQQTEPGLPGERPVSEEERTQQPPSQRERDSETASRAAEEGGMSGQGDANVPSEGVPGQVDAPSPADATDADPPGGSAANQSGRAPDQ
jgi:hypothetical protein